jgi:hypothetical protein
VLRSQGFLVRDKHYGIVFRLDLCGAAFAGGLEIEVEHRKEGQVDAGIWVGLFVRLFFSFRVPSHLRPLVASPNFPSSIFTDSKFSFRITNLLVQHLRPLRRTYL